MDASNTTTALSGAIHPRQRISQNVLLIWIDASMSESRQDYQNTLGKLRSVVNAINIFTQLDEGMNFLIEVHDMKAFLIVADTIGQ